MDLVERIDLLCKRDATTRQGVEQELNLGKGTITKWKSHTPKVDGVMLVAAHFGVSMEYLLTGAEAAQEATPEKIRANGAAKSADAPLSAREEDLVKKFRRLDERGRRTVENALEAALLEVTASDATRSAAREEIA